MSRFRPPYDKTAECLLDTYKTLHYFELERGEKINGRTPTIFGLYSLLLAGFAFVLNDLPKIPSEWDFTLVYPCVVVFFWLLLVGEMWAFAVSCKWAHKFLFVDGYDFVDPIDLHDSVYKQNVAIQPKRPAWTIEP